MAARAHERRQINIYFVIFNDRNPATSFDEIMFQDNPKSKLFIYNENFAHYRTQNYTSAGGGNGFLRQYRKDNSLKPVKAQHPISGIRVHVNALGIPTGSGDEREDPNIRSIDHYPIDFSRSHKIDYSTYNGLVEISMINIFNFIGYNNITDVYLSSKADFSGLGLGIFGNIPWTIRNLERINYKLYSMLRELNLHYDVYFKSLTAPDAPAPVVIRQLPGRTYIGDVPAPPRRLDVYRGNESPGVPYQGTRKIMEEGDGNCLFRTLARQIRREDRTRQITVNENGYIRTFFDDVTLEESNAVRTQICNWLTTNIDKYLAVRDGFYAPDVGRGALALNEVKGCLAFMNIEQIIRTWIYELATGNGRKNEILEYIQTMRQDRAPGTDVEIYAYSCLSRRAIYIYRGINRWDCFNKAFGKPIFILPSGNVSKGVGHFESLIVPNNILTVIDRTVDDLEGDRAYYLDQIVLSDTMEAQLVAKDLDLADNPAVQARAIERARERAIAIERARGRVRAAVP